jgi:hypothetical protein
LLLLEPAVTRLKSFSTGLAEAAVARRRVVRRFSLWMMDEG